MAWNNVMSLVFDSEAKADNWWSIYNSNPSALARPAYVPQYGNEPAHISLIFAPEDGVLPAVTLFETQAAMNANLNFDAGTYVNCAAKDPSIRGRYQKIGASGTGSWNRVGPMMDKCWPDNNHQNRELELILCSWINTTPPAPGAGPFAGWVSPPGDDWSKVRITFQMRAKELYLGPWAKICQHVQGDVPHLSQMLPRWLTFSNQPAVDSTITVNGTVFTFKASGAAGNQINIGVNLAATLANIVSVLTASVIPAVAEATYSADATKLTAISNAQDGTPFTMDSSVGSNAIYTWGNAIPNFIFTKELISDQLGFGVDSWGQPNKEPYVYDSGTTDVVLNYSDSDDDWTCLGSVERPVSFFHYVTTSIKDIIYSLFGNSYMMAVHDMPQPDDTYWNAVSVPIAERDRIRGELRIYGITVEAWTD